MLRRTRDGSWTRAAETRSWEGAEGRAETSTVWMREFPDPVAAMLGMTVTWRGRVGEPWPSPPAEAWFSWGRSPGPRAGNSGLTARIQPACAPAQPPDMPAAV